MGQAESQPHSEKSSHRFSLMSRPSHNRSQSMTETSTAPLQITQNRAQSPPPPPPGYGAFEAPSARQSTDEANRRASIDARQPPIVPAVNPARRRQAVGTGVNSGHRRNNTEGNVQEIMTHHSSAYCDQPTNQAPLLSRTVNNGGNRAGLNTAQPAPVPFPTNTSRRPPSIEEPLMQLLRYDIVFIVDDSTSMEGALWEEARAALARLADMAARYDSDGIDIYFLNAPEVGRGLSAAEVNRLFERVQPEGITPTGEKLDELLSEYQVRLERAKAEAEAGHPSNLQQIKPINFLVITDGAPTDDPESVIVAAARRLDAGRFLLSQVGIQFVQIGDDPDATEALRVLDDDLAGKYGIRDIVDTTPYSGGQLDAVKLTKILLGGINRREDRRVNV